MSADKLLTDAAQIMQERAQIEEAIKSIDSLDENERLRKLCSLKHCEDSQ